MPDATLNQVLKWYMQDKIDGMRDWLDEMQGLLHPPRPVVPKHPSCSVVESHDPTMQHPKAGLLQLGRDDTIRAVADSPHFVLG